MQIATTDAATKRALTGDAPARHLDLIRPWALERVDGADVSHRLFGMQAARGLAAMAVVATHAISHPLKDQEGIVGFPGLYGVALFFVISGYIMVRTTGDGRFNARTFLTRRLRRIVPLYYIACATLALAALVLPYSFRTTTLDVVHILKSLLFIPSFAPRAPGEILPFYKLGWTLNQEMFFYIVFAALAFLNARGRVLVITVLFGGLVVAGRLLTIESAIPRFYTYPIILGFVAGMWLARIRLAGGQRLTAGVAGMLSIASVMSLFGLGRHYDLFTTHELPFIVWLIATVCAQIAAVIFYVDRGGLRVPRWASALGDASYSIYLFHMFGIGLALVVVRTLAPDRLWLAMAIAAVTATVFGLVVHRLIEAPLMARLNRRAATPVRRGADIAA